MGSKTDVVVKLVLVFFISLLSFSIGTFVGKKFSDNQHQIAQLEGTGSSNASHNASEHGAREIASTKGGHDSESHEKKENLSDEEIAKLAEEFVADDLGTEGAHKEVPEKVAQHKETQHNKEAQHKESAETHGKEHQEAAHSDKHAGTQDHAAKMDTHAAHQDTHVAHDSHKAPSEEHQRAPTAVAKDSLQYNVGKFTVQIASYGTENEAVKVTSDLKTKGFNAYFVSANVNGKTWYRVSVGQFSTMNEAKTFRLELIEKAKVSSAFVQKIVKE